MFFGIHGDAAKPALYNKRGKVLVAVDFCKYDEYIGKATIGDPHLLPVEEVMCSLGIKFSAGSARIGIGPRIGLREAVSRFPFARSQLGHIVFLLGIVAIVKDG